MTILNSRNLNGTLATLPGARVHYQAEWLAPPQATALLTLLQREIPWEVHRIRMFGRDVDSPRLSCWMGDAEARYRYSGRDFQPHPWLPVLAALRDRLHGEFGVAFNSVLANRYRDGHDAMGWHSDNEPELGPQPVIASVSLGAERRFLLKHRQLPVHKLTCSLAHGSLLVMAGNTQAHYRHALPRTARQVGERINLTFRQIQRQ